MIQAVIGFFGGVVQAVLAAFTAATGLTFFVILWLSGALPPLLELPGILLSGFFAFMGKGLDFLIALLGAVRAARGGG